MKIIANYNKGAKKWLPSLGLVKNVEASKKEIKKQIIEQIINEPETLKAYKNLEIYEIGEIDDNLTISKTDKKLLFSYEQILNEIIDDLTKENKKWLT